MLRIATICISALIYLAPAHADDFPGADAARDVIEHQLQAFAADDAQTAFSFAAPVIIDGFGTAETFVDMVKRGYRPVYRNRSHSFEEGFIDKLGRPTLRVRLTGLDGISYDALYTLELQSSGEWKISGCTILPVAELHS
jgi:Domain of unknown function (DUF4864)